MLTDTFFVRYESVRLFDSYSEREKRLLFQCFTMLEEIRPFWKSIESDRKRDSLFWESLHTRISNELGIRWLSNPGPDPILGKWEYRPDAHRSREWIEICRNWTLQSPGLESDADQFIKERLSLVEVGLREILSYSETANVSDKFKAFVGSILAEMKRQAKEQHDAAAEELNARLSSARVPLDYHNGFLQRKDDSLSAEEIERPFWSLVSEAMWTNVDIDMKEALDQRDSGGKDPALYASRALESTIKIMSDNIGTTHGSERGASNYIDNLAKGLSAFLADWEAELLRSYFSKVRNPLNHGSGTQPMPTLKSEQTSWAIESAMSWVKLLLHRYSTRNQLVAQ